MYQNIKQILPLVSLLAGIFAVIALAVWSAKWIDRMDSSFNKAIEGEIRMTAAKKSGAINSYLLTRMEATSTEMIGMLYKEEVVGKIRLTKVTDVVLPKAGVCDTDGMHWRINGVHELVGVSKDGKRSRLTGVVVRIEGSSDNGLDCFGTFIYDFDE